MSVLHLSVLNQQLAAAQRLVMRDHMTVKRTDVELGGPRANTRMFARILHVKKVEAETAVLRQSVGAQTPAGGRFGKVEVAYYRMLYLGTCDSKVMLKDDVSVCMRKNTNRCVSVVGHCVVRREARRTICPTL